MTSTHRCPRCDIQVPRSRLACRDDWFALPDALRAAVSETYRPGQTLATCSEAYQAALRDALDWYAANPKVVPGG